MAKLIYLDNAATTQVYQEVLDAMLPYFTEHYGNPSAIYSFAGESKKAVDEARANVADLINARPEDIYFTGGGSESDNWFQTLSVDKMAAASVMLAFVIAVFVLLLERSWEGEG